MSSSFLIFISIFFAFYFIFLLKKFGGLKNSRTFASAFGNQLVCSGVLRKSSLKDLHNRVVVQEEASALLLSMFCIIDVDV